jgi:hypothetical protein
MASEARTGTSMVNTKLIPCLDVMNVPKWWASVTVAENCVLWKEHSKGGHFPSVEKPRELVEDIREFTGLMNPSNLAAVIKSGKLKK